MRWLIQSSTQRRPSHVFDDIALLTDEDYTKTTRIEWHKPVFADDVLTGKAVVTQLARRNACNGLAELTIYAYNQHSYRYHRGHCAMSAVMNF